MTGLEALEDFGFARNGDEMSVLICKGTPSESRVLLLDASTLRAPTDSTTRFIAVSPRRDPDPQKLYFDIAFETAEPHDIMAFAVAAENDGLWNEVGIVPEDRMFGAGNVAVSNPFADDQYGDWVGTSSLNWAGNSDGRVIFVTDPSERSWKDEYRTWRDERWPSPDATPATAP